MSISSLGVHMHLWVSQAVSLWVASSHICSPSCLIQGEGVFSFVWQLWPNHPPSERREGLLQAAVSPPPLAHCFFLSFPRIRL